MRHSVITTLDEVATIEKQWKRLVSEIPTSSVYDTYEFIVDSWKSLSSKQDLLQLIVIREGDDLVGLCPLYLTSTVVLGKKLRTIKHIGFFDGDRPSVIGADKEALWKVVFEALTKTITAWDMIVLSEQPMEDTPLIRSFRSDSRYTLKEQPYSVRYLSDTSQDFNALYESLSRSSRKHIRRMLRKNSSREQPLTIVKYLDIGDPEFSDELLGRYVAIEEKTWKVEKGIGIKHRYAHYSRLLRDFAKEKMVSYWFLQDDGEDVAALIVYTFHATLVAAHVTYNPAQEYKSYSPGALTIQSVVEYACSTSSILFYDPLATPIDLGRPMHKTLFATEDPVQTRNITIYKIRGFAGVLVFFMWLKSRMRRILHHK